MINEGEWRMKANEKWKMKANEKWMMNEGEWWMKNEGEWKMKNENEGEWRMKKWRRMTNEKWWLISRRSEMKSCAQNVISDVLLQFLMLQYTAARCNALQHAATHCNTLQHTPGNNFLWVRLRFQSPSAVFDSLFVLLIWN